MNKINKIRNMLDSDKGENRCNFIGCARKRPEGSKKVSYDTERKKGNSQYQGPGGNITDMFKE